MTDDGYFNDDMVIACADLVGRGGASGFEIGYLHDDVPVDQAGWYAVAQYQGTRLIADEHKSPTHAALALAERMLRGAQCRCHRPVTLSDASAGCRWRLVGQKWEPGCDVPPITVRNGRPGDYAAMQRAYAESSNRADRRHAARKGRKR